MIGRIVSHYRIVSRIGVGGMGVVYKAEDTKLKRIVALKFLPQELTRDEEAKKRFVREAQAASALQHNNICTIHEIDETDDGQMFICMDYYEGENLKERTRRGPLSLADALDVVGKIAEGLATAHSKGMVHRDIKPANVMLTSGGEVKIVDFGLAKLSGGTKVTKTGTMVGTVAYMSPEQASGGDVDHRSDIFSLGVVCYELLTGRLPFRAEHYAAVLYAIINENPTLPSRVRVDLPASLDAVVMRALAKEPDKRYANITEMIDDLKRVTVTSTVTIAVDSNMRPVMATRLGGRRTAVWTLVGIAAVLIIGLAVWRLGVRAPGLPPAALARSIGVMYFLNLSNDPALDWMQAGIVELLNTALSRSSDVTVLDSQRMARILRDLGGDPRRPVDQALAAEVAERAGVTLMLVGNIIKHHEIIRLQVKMIDVDSGAILHADFVEGRVQDDIFDMVAQLTKRIQSYLQISHIDETMDEGWIRDVTTTSVDAYRDYIRGRELFMQSKHQKAREYLERAAAADSNFVMPYVDLMGVCFNLEDYACIAMAYKKALRLRPNASRQDQLSIDLAGAVINDQADLLISVAKELLTIDPNVRFWRYLLGRGYYTSGRFEQALKVWTPLSKERWDWLWVYAYASDACLQLGRYDNGMAIIKRGLDITSDDRTVVRSVLYRYRGRLHRDAGSIEAALADFRTAAELNPEYETITKYDIGILHQQQGDVESALRYFNEYLDEDPSKSYADDVTDRIQVLQAASAKEPREPSP